MRRSLRVSALAAAGAVVVGGVSLLVPGGAQAARFSGGDLVVYRVGDGSAALSNAAAPVFLDEFTSTGTKLQSLALPTAASGDNQPLTATGLSRSEGLITTSPDGKYLTVTGYDAAPGTTGTGGASLTASSTTSVGRTVGVVDGNGTIDTSTVLTGSSVPSIVRSAATADGTTLYAAGGNGGLLQTTLASTGHSVVGDAGGNITGLSIQGGRLFAGGILDDRLASFGSPTSPTSTPTDVDGLPSSLLTYGYAFLDQTSQSFDGTGLDTLYIANASERGGTVDKYSFDGTQWSSDGYVDVPGAFGLVADANGSSVSLAVTTPTSLVTLTDPHGDATSLDPGPISTLATAPVNTEFRGVALAPTAPSGPSVFIHTPQPSTSVSLTGSSVSTSALVASPDGVKSVSATLGSGAAVTATKGTGGIYTASLPLAGATAGASTITITATDDDDNVTTATRSVTLTKASTPTGDAGPGTYAWTNKLVKRTGTWTTYSTKLSPTGKGETSKKAKSTASVTVYGRSLVLTFTTGPKLGKATVVVGSKTETVDLYAKKAGSKKVTFSFSGALSAHKVKITVSGKKSSKSKGTAIDLAAFQVKS